MANLGGGGGLFNSIAGAGAGYKKARGIAQTNYEQGLAAINSNYDQAQAYQQPWQDFGQNALQGFQSWSTDPNAISSDPSYQFRFNQGQNALENSAAAHGGLLSGNAGKALTDYGQNAASQEYANQFARWMQQLGIGQNASNNMTNLSVGRGNALNNAYTAMGSNWFNNTMTADSHLQSGETNLNNIIQSWVPASAGGGKPGNNTLPSSTQSSSGGDYTGSASPANGNYAGNQNYQGGNSGQFNSYSNSFGW